MPYVWSGGRQTADRFLINNVPGVEVTALAELARGSIVDPAEMNRRIDERLGKFLKKLPRDAHPLVIYPGNGAAQLQGVLPALINISSMSIMAKRHWQPSHKPVSDVRSFTISPAVTHCLVVDDVISSGETMYAVRRCIPAEVECWAVSQMSQRIGDKRNRKFAQAKYRRVITGIELSGNGVSSVPINSISTLRKDEQLAQSYALRHVPCAGRKRFLELLGHHEQPSTSAHPC